MGGVYNSFNLGLYGYGHLNPLKFTDPDGKLALPWHFGITYVAARDSGRSFTQSVSLAWKTMMVDLRSGSQGTDAEHTKVHAMAGTIGETGKYQTREQALQATKGFIESNITGGGDVPGALHATEDLATPRHAGEQWKGFTLSPVPLSGDIFDSNKVKEHFKDFKETMGHLGGDIAPSPTTVRNAYRNAVDVLKGERHGASGSWGGSGGASGSWERESRGASGTWGNGASGEW